MKIKTVLAVMVARVKKADAAALERRRREYLRKNTWCRTLRASKERQHLAERVKTRREGMEHPIFEAYTLHPIGWSRKWRPKTKEQASAWKEAVRRGILPLGAYIVTKPGSDLLAAGALVGIVFFAE